MIPVSESLKALLHRQGISAGSVGAGRANGLASTPISGEEGQTSKRSPTAGEGLQPMGMGKGTPAETGASQQGGNVRFERSRSPILQVHTNPNAGHMPTRQRRGDVRLSLVRT
jgi:hypothetical protein